MRAGQDGDPARAGECRVESGDHRGDPPGFGRFVVVPDDGDQFTVGPSRLDLVVVLDRPERACARSGRSEACSGG